MLPHAPTGKRARRVRPGLSPEASERTRAKCENPLPGSCRIKRCARHESEAYLGRHDAEAWDL